VPGDRSVTIQSPCRCRLVTADSSGGARYLTSCRGVSCLSRLVPAPGELLLSRGSHVRFVPGASRIRSEITARESTGFSRSKGTNLLFPFLTNTNGFDTAIAISNTAADPFGTVGKAGKCTLTFFGSGSPTPFTSAIITPGGQATFLMSTIAPGFQGYGIAQCAFQFGHGFAFVSDLGARNLAMGYLPLVICSNRAASPVEQLLP
jgi:hypothetical protein